MAAKPIGWIDHDLVCLFAGRLLRSFSQAYLVIIVPLYLARLGYDAVHLGVLFSIAAAAGAMLAATIGFLSDRIGRKPLLIAISLMTGAAGGIFAISTGFVVLTAAAALGTIGRGGGAAGGGGYGPFYPAEQALIAEHAKDADRTTVFAALSFVGLVGGTIGSLVAWLPDLLRQHGLPLLQGYRVLFAFTVLIGLGMAAAVLPVREAGLNHASDRQILSAYTKHGRTHSDRRWRLGLSPVTWNLICRFMLTNVTNGLAGGMLGPLLVYWFHRRYGVEAAQIGQLYFAINFLAAIADVTASGITARIGTVRTVAISRALSALLLGAMVLMPTF
jgi:MFS family permease